MEAIRISESTALPKVQAPEPFTKPFWWDDVTTRDGMSRYAKGKHTFDYRQVVKSFLLGELNKRMRVKANNGNHVFYSKNNGEELWIYKDNPSIKVNIMVAKKFNGVFVGNASSLSRLRSTSGKLVMYNQGRFRIQAILEECMMMLPFQMFKETKLDIQSLVMIDRGPAEWVDVKRPGVGVQKTHFMGAMVFKIKANRRSAELHYNGKGQYFLFDIDRNDLKLKNLNFFLSRLSKPVNSIEEAYLSLKPQEVSDAERFLGKPCDRQGEWFFIPVQGEFQHEKEKTWDGKQTQRHAQAILQSKGNRAHYVEKLSVEGYVKGKVTHGGREHEPITLETWCKPVPNTAVESFKISGAID